MNFELVDISEILNSDWIDEYTTQIDHVWHQILQLNTNMFILEKVWKFPFEVFCIHEPLFWRAVSASLYESCILIISKLAINSHKSKLSLNRLKNEIRKHLKPELLSEFDLKLNTLKFDKTVNKLKSRICALRNNRIAHYDKEWNSNVDIPKLNKIVLNLEELIEIKSKIEQLFNVLCFSKKHSTDFMEYSPLIIWPKGETKSTDIEELLDNIAKHSGILNMPEEQSEFWTHYRQQLGEHDLGILNKYRHKFGLSNV